MCDLTPFHSLPLSGSSMPRLILPLAMLFLATSAMAAEFNITAYGAKPDDDGDDTLAVVKALEACGKAGGGTVVVPTGTFQISRQGAESPILAIPSNTTFRGEGPASVLKFDPKVNTSNFWRMLGAPDTGCKNVTIRDLHLDGSNTHPKYAKGVPEQSHGMFFSNSTAPIENLMIRDVLVENFAGDCIAIGRNCRNVTIRDVKLRNFLRQGIQMAGGDGARDYLVTGCQDLEHTIQPGGSTIHVEHARGLKNVIITSNHCRRSLLAGGVDGLLVENNVIEGRLEGNGNTNARVQGNLIRSVPGAKASIVQLGFADGLVLRDNMIVVEGEDRTGIYVWGKSKYNPEPSREVVITGNVIRPAAKDGTIARGIELNGVIGATVKDNRIRGCEPEKRFKMSRSEDIVTDLAK